MRYRADLDESQLRRMREAFEPAGGLRFGQTVVNAFLAPGQSDPEVYYCEDMDAAFDLLMDRIKAGDRARP